jgi:hypothetical protein
MSRAAGRARIAKFLTALVLAASAFAIPAIPAAPALAWANNGDGYATHDWIIDQALKVLNGRVDGWFNAEIARLASDDPDTVEVAADPSRGTEHVYHETGKRGGAIDRIATEFDIAAASYQRGVDAKAAGDDSGARAAWDDASYHIGLLAHIYGDILQPFHTAYAAMNYPNVHVKYELVVTTGVRKASDRPEWSSSRRTVSTFSNIRTKAIAAAAYSRSYFHELYREFAPNPTRLTARASTITGLVLKRASNDLADVIWCISQGCGAAPQVGSLKIRVKWTGVKSGSSSEVVFVTARDVNGHPIEGLKVTVAWPTATGTRTEVLYTDPTGNQKRQGSVGTSPKLVLRDVIATTTVRGVTMSARGRWAITPRLPSGRAGFKTVVSDSTVVPGQVVKVTSLARDSKGRPVPNLLITWTWDYNGRKVRTHGVTDATGHAWSTQLITGSTTKARVTVTASTQSGSVNRSSSTTFKRSS